MALYKNFKRVSKDCPERSMLDPEGPLSSKVPSSCSVHSQLRSEASFNGMKVLEQFRIYS